MFRLEAFKGEVHSKIKSSLRSCDNVVLTFLSKVNSEALCVSLALRSSLMKVVLGEHTLETEEGSEQILSVSNIFVHNFSYSTFNNDIMLIKVGRRGTM